MTHFKKWEFQLQKGLPLGFWCDMPNPVTYLNQAPKFEWFVIRCGSKEQIPKTQIFQKDWTTCSKYISHSNSQQKWVRLYDHLMRTGIFTLITRYSYELQDS
jgi:hypothetical protein